MLLALRSLYETTTIVTEVKRGYRRHRRGRPPVVLPLPEEDARTRLTGVFVTALAGRLRNFGSAIIPISAASLRINVTKIEASGSSRTKLTGTTIQISAANDSEPPTVQLGQRRSRDDDHEALAAIFAST